QCSFFTGGRAGDTVQGGLCQFGRELPGRSGCIATAPVRSRSRGAVSIHRSTGGAGAHSKYGAWHRADADNACGVRSVGGAKVTAHAEAHRLAAGLILLTVTAAFAAAPSGQDPPPDGAA